MIATLFWLGLAIVGPLALILWDPAHLHPTRWKDQS